MVRVHAIYLIGLMFSEVWIIDFIKVVNFTCFWSWHPICRISDVVYYCFSHYEKQRPDRRGLNNFAGHANQFL